MSTGNDNKSLLAPLGGVVVGVAVFLGVNITAGRAIVPTVASVTNHRDGMSDPVYHSVEAEAAAPAGGPYQTVCQACHQAEGEGVSGAFPPLAGSEWVTGDPETPIRITLLGLTGEIEVKGVKYNSTMPPPPGLSDEQIAEAVTYARTNFGNNASKVDAAMVAKVRESLGGRTESWTATELAALRPAGGAEPAAQDEGEAAPAEAAGEPAAAEGEGEAPEAAPAAAQPEAATEAAAPEAAAPEGN